MSTKDRVLIRLEEAGPQGVSGEALAKELQVSRAAVWKAIQALRAEGVAIESAPGSGYRLAGPASLSREGILRALEEAGISVDVETFRSIDSTNSEARRRGMEIRRPLLLAADEQTAGRGRQGRSFYSPSLSGVYLTLAMPTRLPLQDAALATQAMAVAAARAVEEAGGPSLSIKWVNDLFLDGRKVAGILTEAVSDLEAGQAALLICGIGLNLTTEQFPGAIDETAGSLGALNRSRLCALIVKNALPLFEALPDTGWLAEYRARSLVLGRRLVFEKNGVSYHCVGEAIDDRGGLTVVLDHGDKMTLTSGEVSVRPEI